MSTTITVVCETEEIANNFLTFMSEQGEQDYWLWYEHPRTTFIYDHNALKIIISVIKDED